MARKALALIIVAFAGLTAAAFVVGFRSGWSLGIGAYNSVRASNAVVQALVLSEGRADAAVSIAEAEVDLALQTWRSVDSYPFRFALNQLAGEDVIPGLEIYISRVAIYRQQHPSPLPHDAQVAARLAEVVDRYAENRPKKPLERSRER